MSKLPNLFVQNPRNLGNGYAVPVHSFDRAAAPTAEMYVPAAKLRELVESWRERIGSGDWPRICAAELEALIKEPG